MIPLVTALRRVFGAGSDISSTNLLPVANTLLEKVRHPFGKGSLTTNGVQYSTEVSSIGDTYTSIGTITIQQPPGYTLEEIEFGLTGAVKSSGAGEGVNWKWQASDDGVSWQDLIAEQTRAADASAYADVSCSGRFAPTGNFLGTGASFRVRMVIKNAVTNGVPETASGKAKNSSYILARYRRT